MGRSPFIRDKPHESISLCVYGDETGLRMWNNPNDPMPIKIAGGKTLEQCVFYRGGGITVYTDNSVTVKSYDGFYDYYLTNERKMSEVMMLPVDGEEVSKDEEYYKKLINSLAVDYNKQVENAPNLYRNTMVLQDINTPTPIDFACTVFADGQIWIGGGYSVGTADKPPCPVNVPSGKLAFVTKATSDTHSFVMKSVKCGNELVRTLWQGDWSKERVEKTEGSIFESDIMFSKSFISVGLIIKDIGKTEGRNAISVSWNNDKPDSFTQLLLYKANFTEAELKTENAKTIRLR